MGTKAASEMTPRSRNVTMLFAVAIAGFIGLAVFSFSRLKSAPWNSVLGDPVIQDTPHLSLPQFQHDDLAKLLTFSAGEAKWTLLTFWSMTCGPCIEELPTLNALAATWQGPPLQVLTANLDSDSAENRENSKLLLQEEQITVPTVYDNGQLKKAFEVTEYPKHLLISPDKQIVWQAVGAFDWSEIETRDQLLKLMEKQAPLQQADPVE